MSKYPQPDKTGKPKANFPAAVFWKEKWWYAVGILNQKNRRINDDDILILERYENGKTIVDHVNENDVCEI